MIDDNQIGSAGLKTAEIAASNWADVSIQADDQDNRR
jgi:hypothetical protein